MTMAMTTMMAHGILAAATANDKRVLSARWLHAVFTCAEAMEKSAQTALLSLFR